MAPVCCLCAGDLGAGAAPACVACQRRLAGAAPVRATGEFVVPALPPELAASGAGAAVAPGPSGACDWCSKPAAEVKKLLGNGRVAICDGCVALCADVLDAELGTWRA